MTGAARRVAVPERRAAPVEPDDGADESLRAGCAEPEAPLAISGVLLDLSRRGTGERVSFGDLVEAFEIGAYGPLIVLFAAPNVLPVALPGISAVLGAPLILITAQLMLGRRRPWLPGVLRRRSIRRVDLARLVERVAPRLERIEARMRPRHPLLTGKVGRRAVGALGLVLATIIFLPIPFGNSLPGLALVLMALGLLARDGLMVAAGGGVAAAGLVVASGFAWGVVTGSTLVLRNGLGL